MVVSYCFYPIGLSGQVQLGSVTRSMSLVPANQPGCSSDWLGQDELCGRQGATGAEHAPLSPQGSVASSGSEQTEDQTNTRNTFQEDGSGMKGEAFVLQMKSFECCSFLFNLKSNFCKFDVCVS